MVIVWSIPPLFNHYNKTEDCLTRLERNNYGLMAGLCKTGKKFEVSELQIAWMVQLLWLLLPLLVNTVSCLQAAVEL